MQPRFQQFFYLSAFIFCTGPAIYSQNNSSLLSNNNFPFDHIEFYNSTHGLNGNEVSWMTQDKNGFLWFITDNALNRFDGYTFRSFGYNPADTNSISTGWYFGLKEDNNGVLWFPDEHKGLHSFNPLQQKFMTYPHQNGRKSSPDYDFVHSFAIEDDSLLWVATPAGLDRFNQRTKTYTNFINYGDPSAVPFNTISSLEFDKYIISNRRTPYLWLTTDKGLACFNTQSGKLDAHYDFPFSSHPEQWYGYINLNIKKSGIAWIGSDDNGLYGFNTIARQYIRIKSERKCQNIFHHINGSNQVNGFFFCTGRSPGEFVDNQR